MMREVLVYLLCMVCQKAPVRQKQCLTVKQNQASSLVPLPLQCSCLKVSVKQKISLIKIPCCQGTMKIHTVRNIFCMKVKASVIPNNTVLYNDDAGMKE